MEIKIDCQCGTRFSFDVEPVNGRMPVGIGCPSCQTDATGAANTVIAQHFGQVAPPPPAPAAPPPRMRLATAPAHAAPAAVATAPGEVAQPADATDSALLNRTIFFVKERVSL